MDFDSRKEYLLRQEEIDNLELKFKIHLMNSITGYKSANLVATYNSTQKANAAIFSSVTHYGSSPPLIGITLRPPTESHQTYQNIQRDRFYTINQVHTGIYRAAHQTSGNYKDNESEFEISGLTPLVSATFPHAPYVGESHVRLGLKYIEEHKIKANGTILLIGEIVELFCDGHFIGDDGFIDPVKANTVTVTGLDAYYHGTSLARLERV